MTKMKYYLFYNINISDDNLELLNLTDLGRFAHSQIDSAKVSVAMVFHCRLSWYTILLFLWKQSYFLRNEKHLKTLSLKENKKNKHK